MKYRWLRKCQQRNGIGQDQCVNKGSNLAPEGVNDDGDVVLVYDLVVDGGGQNGEVW